MGFHNSGGGGGGERFTETVLWTNPSPTSAISSNTTITLSEPYNNFDYLKVTYQVSTTDAKSYEVICPTDMLENALDSGGYRLGWLNYTGSYLAVRNLWRATTANYTQLTIGKGEKTNTTGNVNSNVIPLQVIGIKKENVIGTYLNIPIGYLREVSSNLLQFPISITGTVFAYMANVKGYSTLTTNNQNYFAVVGIKSDGSMVALTNYGNTSYSTVDITDYDYLWITHNKSSSHTFNLSIS